MHRFFVRQQLTGKQIRIEDPVFCNQLRNVLRFKAGEEITLFNGDLREILVKINEYAKNSVVVEPISSFANEKEAAGKVLLYCSVLKRENFEWVAQKATETGIAGIIPIITERTIKLNLRLERLEKIIKEAVEQSGRGILPYTTEPVDFKNAVIAAGKNQANFLFDISGQPIQDFPEGPDPVGIWIGPEGGWTEKELRIAKDNDFKISKLGQTILRAETAAIIGSYVFVNKIKTP